MTPGGAPPDPGAALVVGDVDTVLSTTRSVRRRLDLDRPVPDQVLLDCIDLAEQAPTGGNVSSRRWLIVRDPARKEALAELYRSAGGQFIIDAAARLAGSGRPNEAVTRSGAFLAENLQRVPAIVIPTIWGTYDGSGQPGLFDSVLQAAWSFCLALRARGLGSAWTTVHLNRAADVADLLGIPEGITQVALLPVAYTVGTEFRPAARRSAAEITYIDSWGRTRRVPGQGGAATLADGPGFTGEVEVDARPDRVWAVLAEADLPAGGSAAHHVVASAPPRRLTWYEGDLGNPAVEWRIELDPLPGGRTRLRQAAVLGDDPSGVDERGDAAAGQDAARLAERLGELAEEVTASLGRLRSRAELG